MRYSIKKQFGEGQNEFDSVIEIADLTSEVTVNTLLDHVESCQKTAKEQAGQMEANSAQMKMAIEALPILKDIPEDKLNLALSYISKYMANKEAVVTIAMCESTISTYMGHLKSIEEQTGIKCVPVLSPIQQPDVEKGE